MKVTVVIPTYNEAENLPRLVDCLLALGIPGLKILIVDDNSPDGTGIIADQLAAKSPHHVAVIHRQEKLGLGSAYVTGFTKALEEGADFIFEMDADFSHPPECLPQFLEKLKEYDVVVGSRYVPGGGVDPSWGFWRRFLSRAGNLYARLVGGLMVCDATSGFKGFRREVLQNLNLASFLSDGYAFQIEMAHACQNQGYRVAELPITFRERAFGVSKLSFHIVSEALRRVWQLRKTIH